MIKQKIYTLWYQGFESAPDIVKICHRSLWENYNPAQEEIVVLNEKNIHDHVELPGYIWDKFQAGIISRTHLSDLIRSKILCENGGLWVDATILFTRTLDHGDIFGRDFFTFKRGDSISSDITSRWTCFFMGGQKDFPLLQLLVEFWETYWKKENQLITYLLTDHVFYQGWANNKQIHRALEQCPTLSLDIDGLQSKMNLPFSENDFQKMALIDPICKLSYKFSLFDHTTEGERTYYGALKERYHVK